LEDQSCCGKTRHTLESGDLIRRPLVELDRGNLSSKSQELLEHVCCGQYLEKGQHKEHCIIVRSLKHKQRLKLAKSRHVVNHTCRMMPRSFQGFCVPNQEAILVVFIHLFIYIGIDLFTTELAYAESIDASRPGIVILLAISGKVSA
jgi:hypothetical protein